MESLVQSVCINEGRVLLCVQAKAEAKAKAKGTSKTAAEVRGKEEGKGCCFWKVSSELGLGCMVM